MNEPLEDRLRHHLSSVDAAGVRDPDAVRSAVAGRVQRRRRRRRIGATAASLALVVGSGVAIWSNRTSPASTVPATTGAPTTIASTTSTSTTIASTTSVGTTLPATTLPGTTLPGTAPSGSWRIIAPDPRGVVWAPSAVWTGTEALVVGGVDLDGKPVGGAGAYDPANDTWRRLADPLDGARPIDPLAVWTGTVMLVVGGDNPDGTLLVSAGEAYDVSTDTWRHIAPPPTGFVSDRSPFVWTGHELLVWPWDGGGSTMAITPIAYDPSTDAWHSLPQAPIARRQSAASVWTGTEWIVWGGSTGSDELADGAAYNPTTDTWRTIASSPLSKRRVRGVWTGHEMIVDAGSTGGDRITGNGEMALADGAAYDPATDTWRVITPGLAHPGFVPVWTGRDVVMFAKGSAVVYDVAADRWVDTCCSGSGVSSTPVWTGTVILLVGSGRADTGGGIFTPP